MIRNIPIQWDGDAGYDYMQTDIIKVSFIDATRVWVTTP